MSTETSNPSPRAGYLLLRDGHAIPLAGISPAEIKAGAKHRVPNPDAEPVRHRQALTAIVQRLGFRGDWGDYQSQHWPAFQAFLTRAQCHHRARMFPSDHGGSRLLFFNRASGPNRRQLADRVFESAEPLPSKVFLGHGISWETWDQVRYRSVSDVLDTIPGLDESAVDAIAHLFHGPRECRWDLWMQWGFLDNKLVKGQPEPIVDKSYWPSEAEASLSDRQRSLENVTAAVQAFRSLFDASEVGWVEVIPYNDRLVVLRGHDGAWEVLWRSYRQDRPPQPSDTGLDHHLAVEDLPSRLMTESNLERSVHFRQEVWDEKEAHEAEQAFYDRGGSTAERRETSWANIRIEWLREKGQLPVPERMQWSGVLPTGFHLVKVDGRKQVAMTDLIDAGSFRQMLADSGYGARRWDDREPWERANHTTSDDEPVGAAWTDAQAYCAWLERKLGVVLRLPSKDELRCLRPAYSAHYHSMANQDFPWENYPPRPLPQGSGGNEGREVPSAVIWSEPRFLEPSTDVPEYPPPSGCSSTSRKRWIKDFPPRATWKSDLPWAQYEGLQFIDAWDAYEWCQEWGWISGRFWEGHIGPTSWGAYKNIKVGFRLVLDLEG